MLVKMGAAIEGIGSNVMTVHGAERLRGCEHTVAPDHIEIGSFMALAGVTGGELRIKDTVPEDLRMIRLVFERLGLRTELRRRRRARARRPEAAIVQATPASYKSKVEDGPWPAFPADLTSIALALATQAEGSVLILEKMFENRLFFTDKLILMGAEIMHLRPAPGDRHRPAPAARRARRVARHPRRHGDADRRAVRRGPQRDRQRPPDRPRLRAHRRAPARRSARASSASRPSPSTPSGLRSARRHSRHDPPDPQRHARRPARRDARAARDHRARCAASFERARLRRGLHARARVRDDARARRRRRRRGPPTGCSTSTATCSCCART